jgi:hypothetical protein
MKEALRLADALDSYATGDDHQRDIEQAADELRRLHEVNAELLEALEKLARLGNGERYGNSEGNVIARRATMPVQEPVRWDKPSASFDEWWDGDRRRDTANPFTTDSFAYWAFEGWQAALAQRPWQGLTEEEVKHLYPYGRSVWGKETFEAIEKALKEKNSA